jgi:stringent starvation protein B
MLAIKPYLVRAIHQWAVDAGYTPHILVDAKLDGVRVPSAYVKDGQIILNIHPQAVSGLELGDESVVFSARFSGKEVSLEVPLKAVSAIFAKENGQGMTFPDEVYDQKKSPGNQQRSTSEKKEKDKKRPSLKVIK